MRIKFFTNIAPHYRASLWGNLLNQPSCEIHFFYGHNSKSGIQTIDFSKKEFSPYKNQLHQIKNSWLKGKILIWQKGVISQCLRSKFDQAIFLGDMYCLSTWIAAIICRLRGIEVAFWGHGIYGNEGKLKLLFRKIFYRLAHKHLIYERRAKQLMVKEGFSPEKLYVVFNSLNYDEHKMLCSKLQHLNKYDVYNFFINPALPVLIFVGRITTEKKLHMLLKAVENINKQQSIVNLIIIGDGPAKENLVIQGKKGIKEGWLHFTGACYNEEELGRYFFTSDLCISPGNVGLTAVHSLSFGTPVCTHNNFNNQGPEAEIIIEGYNGFLFKENDTNVLKERIEDWLETSPGREKVRERCYEVVDTYYNPYYQLSVFNRLINNEMPEL